MVVEVNYDHLLSTSNMLAKASVSCGEYARRIGTNVPQKLDNIASGSSSYTSSASYFASAKIKSLENQKQKLLSVSRKINDLVEDAKATDQRVASIMKRDCNSFRKATGLSHSWSDGLTQMMKLFANGVVKKKEEISKWIANCLCDMSDAFNCWVLDIKHWYARVIGNDKYKIQVWVRGAVWLAAGLTVFAACIVAFPAVWKVVLGVISKKLTRKLLWEAFSATCTAITSCIALADATVDLIYTKKARDIAQTDPKWAKHYADISSLTEWLRKGSEDSENSATRSKLAQITNFVQSVCTVVSYGNMLKNGYLFFIGKYRANAAGIKLFKIWDDNQHFSTQEMLKNWKHNLKTLDYAFTHDFQYAQWVGARKRNHSTFAALEKMKQHWTYKHVMHFFDKLGDGMDWLDKHIS